MSTKIEMEINYDQDECNYYFTLELPERVVDDQESLRELKEVLSVFLKRKNPQIVCVWLSPDDPPSVSDEGDETYEYEELYEDRVQEDDYSPEDYSVSDSRRL